MNLIVFALPAALLYLLSCLSTSLRLFARPGRHKPSRALGIGLGLAGVLLHGLMLYQAAYSEAGLNLSFFNAFSIVAWTIVLLLLLSSLKKPVDNLGIVLLPIAALTVMLAWRYPGVHLLSDQAPFGLKLHVLVSILAYSLLALASVQAILLAIQDRQLRGHHPGGFVRSLPPLQTMETLLFEMIGLGFVLLTVALGSGFVFLQDMFAQHLAHKTVLSIASWAVFGGLIWGRWRHGWRGRRAIKWTLTGFVVLALAYFGSKFVLELLITR